MKRLFWAFIVLSIQLNVFAYERPFLQEGKRWNFVLENVHFVDKTSDSTVVTSEHYTLFLQGDTIIEGKTYMKMYEQFENRGMVSYMCALAEDSNKQVYCCWNGTTEAQPLYYGSPFSALEPMRYYVRTDSILVSGKVFYRYHFSTTDLYDEDMYILWWIDGVGSLGGPFAIDGEPEIPACACDYTIQEFVSCELPGEWIVTAEDFKKETFTNDIVLPEKEASVTPSYDLSGRRADGKKPGVYIKNGKKFVIK